MKRAVLCCAQLAQREMRMKGRVSWPMIALTLGISSSDFRSASMHLQVLRSSEKGLTAAMRGAPQAVEDAGCGDKGSALGGLR